MTDDKPFSVRAGFAGGRAVQIDSPDSCSALVNYIAARRAGGDGQPAG